MAKHQADKFSKAYFRELVFENVNKYNMNLVDAIDDVIITFEIPLNRVKHYLDDTLKQQLKIALGLQTTSTFDIDQLY